MSNYAVICPTCHHSVYEADTPPDNGQVLLTQFAESTPGTTCPSGVPSCPNKTAALNNRKQRNIDSILGRLTALEARIRQ